MLNDHDGVDGKYNSESRSGFIDCGRLPTGPLSTHQRSSRTTTTTMMPANGKPVLPPIDVQGPLMPPTTTRSPSKLRKSLSVDSFVRLTRPDEPPATSVPATAAARYTSPPDDRPPSSPRVRTYSVSTADTSSRESPLPRTLSDPTVPPRLSNRDRPRRTSEQPLPLNLPPTRPRPSPPNDLARTGPLPGSSHYHPFRESSTSRARSGSLGLRNPTSGVAMVINTQLSSVRFKPHYLLSVNLSRLALRCQVNPLSPSPSLVLMGAGRAASLRKGAKPMRCPNLRQACP